MFGLRRLVTVKLVKIFYFFYFFVILRKSVGFKGLKKCQNFNLLLCELIL